ncbi:DUF1016 N-terminal domain-containing protein [Caulobacter sp. RHG1]|uniref:DUF1016 N-terminal domain-containing protein n=1 Tax=Caulobacter sp. (strain RHG1) TaxID=2545762 RepID=UPI00351B2B1E
MPGSAEGGPHRGCDSARLSAAFAVNRELVTLYWSLGRDIGERERAAGWGAKIITNLAADLAASFPELGGFSPRNLRHLGDFAGPSRVRVCAAACCQIAAGPSYRPLGGARRRRAAVQLGLTGHRSGSGMSIYSLL